MSHPNDNHEDLTGTNEEWSGAGAEYPAGMMTEGSMFPPGRDENIWGQQNPLDFVGPAGPFDHKDGDESWRVSNQGRHVYTGEAIVYSKRSSKEQQEHQTRFWAKYDAQKAQEAGVSAGDYQTREATGNKQFLVVLPTPSGPARVPAPPPNTSQPLATPVPALIQDATPSSAGAAAYPHANSSLPIQQLPAAIPDPAIHTFSDIDGEYETDEDYLPNAPQPQPTPTNNEDREQLPDSTPPKTSSPRGVDDWDDDNLLSIWKLKVIRKKGYEPMLIHFPGQTVETLHETWKAHKGRCEQLGALWKGAGKPVSPVSAWWKE